MKAMTVRQPWALCIASGHKNVENRGRATTHRGEIAIHAAKAHSPEGDTDPRVIRLWGRDARVRADLGAVIAVADLTDCHPGSTSCRVEGSPCWPWSDATYNGGPVFHLMLSNVRRLWRPVHCRGALQVGWTVPADIEQRVRAEVAARIEIESQGAST